MCQTTQQSLRMHRGKACSLLLGAGNYLGKEEKQQKNHAFSPKDAIWKWPIDLVIKMSLLAFKDDGKQKPSLGKSGWQESKGFSICFQTLPLARRYLDCKAAVAIDLWRSLKWSVQKERSQWKEVIGAAGMMELVTAWKGSIGKVVEDSQGQRHRWD